MMIENSQDQIESFSPHSKRRFVILILSSITLSLVLVIISMSMYRGSGAFLLDLSRPGYVSVRAQSYGKAASEQTFSPTGSIDQNSINEYKILFEKQSSKVKSANAFSGDPLDPTSLEISATN